MAYIAEPYDAPVAAVLPKEPLPDKLRYASIDVLKGIAILGIWLVSASFTTPGLPEQLKPGSWGKPTFADCLFPLLIFGIGAGTSLSAFFRRSRDSMGRFFMGAMSKAFWLVLFGLLIESAIARHPIFECGALQLLGVAYLVNAIFARTPIVMRVFLAEGLLLAFYLWAKMTPYPNAPIGTFNEKQNIIQLYEDTKLSPLGLHGLLGLISITSVMMSGSVIGSLYLREDSAPRRGIIFMLVGGTLIFFGWLWSLDQPMVSALWTSSFSLLATGIGISALGLFNFIFEFDKTAKVARLFSIPASSILFAIVAPVFFKTMILDVWKWPNSSQTISETFRRWIETTFSPPSVAWVYPIVSVIVWWGLLAIIFYRRKWLRKQFDSLRAT